MLVRSKPYRTIIRIFFDGTIILLMLYISFSGKQLKSSYLLNIAVCAYWSASVNFVELFYLHAASANWQIIVSTLKSENNLY